MEDEIKYMRIGTSLYKVVRRPGLSPELLQELEIVAAGDARGVAQ